jgi:hypothetical protein
MTMRRGKDGLTKALKDAYEVLQRPNMIGAIQFIEDAGYSLKRMAYQLEQLEKFGLLINGPEGKIVLLPLPATKEPPGGEADGSRTQV